MSILQEKLSKIYKKEQPKHDVFGRRPATREDFGRKPVTPRQIQEHLLQQQLKRDEFPILEPLYQPTPLHIRQKEEGLRRRRFSRKDR